MLLARVIGTVTASHKPEALEGITFLLIEKINPATMEGLDDYVVAMDGVGAGPEEIVFYASGSSARYTPTTLGKPADSTITAIVDSIEMQGRYVYQKNR